MARCKSCNGNDSDAPCAYPGEGKHGCLRDARMRLSKRDDLERVTRMAEECGATDASRFSHGFAKGEAVVMTAEELLAFEQAVLLQEERLLRGRHDLEIESLKAKLAMQAELVNRFPEINTSNYTAEEVTTLNDWGIEVATLNATQPTVDAFMAAHDKAMLDEAFGKPVGCMARLEGQDDEHWALQPTYWIDDFDAGDKSGWEIEPLYRRKKAK